MTGGAGPERADPALTVILTEAELDVLEEAHLRGADPSATPLRRDPPAAGGPGTPDAGDPAAPSPEALREASRSLRLRGLLRPDGRIREDDGPGGQLALMLDVRFVASRVLLVHRIVADGPGQDRPDPSDQHLEVGDRLVHLAQGWACVEDVLADGSRHLHLEPEPDLVPAWVTEVTVPPDAVPGAGAPRTARPDRPEELPELLGRPTVLAGLEALVRPPDGGGPVVASSHRVALGPRGCWVVDLTRGDGPSAVVLRPVGPDWVAGWVRAQLVAVGGQGTMSG